MNNELPTLDELNNANETAKNELPTLEELNSDNASEENALPTLEELNSISTSENDVLPTLDELNSEITDASEQLPSLEELNGEQTETSETQEAPGIFATMKAEKEAAAGKRMGDLEATAHYLPVVGGIMDAEQQRQWSVEQRLAMGEVNDPTEMIKLAQSIGIDQRKIDEIVNAADSGKRSIAGFKIGLDSDTMKKAFSELLMPQFKKRLETSATAAEEAERGNENMGTLSKIAKGTLGTASVVAEFANPMTMAMATGTKIGMRGAALSQDQYQLDENGEPIKVSEGDKDESAWMKALAGGIAEQEIWASGIVGKVLGGATKTIISKIPGAEKIAASALGKVAGAGEKLIEKMKGNPSGQILLKTGEALGKIDEKLHFGSLPNMIAKSRLTEFCDDVVGLNRKEGESESFGEWLDKVTSIEDNVELLTGIIGIHMAMAAAGGFKAAQQRKAFRHGMDGYGREDVIAEYIGADRAKRLSDEDINNIYTLITSPKLTATKVSEFLDGIRQAKNDAEAKISNGETIESVLQGIRERRMGMTQLGESAAERIAEEIEARKIITPEMESKLDAKIDDYVEGNERIAELVKKDIVENLKDNRVFNQPEFLDEMVAMSTEKFGTESRRLKAREVRSMNTASEQIAATENLGIKDWNEAEQIGLVEKDERGRYSGPARQAVTIQLEGTERLKNDVASGKISGNLGEELISASRCELGARPLEEQHAMVDGILERAKGDEALAKRMLDKLELEERTETDRNETLDERLDRVMEEARNDSIAERIDIGKDQAANVGSEPVELTDGTISTVANISTTEKDPNRPERPAPRNALEGVEQSWRLPGTQLKPIGDGLMGCDKYPNIKVDITSAGIVLDGLDPYSMAQPQNAADYASFLYRLGRIAEKNGISVKIADKDSADIASALMNQVKEQGIVKAIQKLDTRQKLFSLLMDSQLAGKVTFDEQGFKDGLSQTNNGRKFIDNHGNIYGFVDGDGAVHFNPTAFTFNTPIHEYGHLALESVKNANYELWKRGMDLIKESSYYKDIERMSGTEGHEYNYLFGDIDGIADEALATMIGDKGERLVENKGIESKLRAWIKEFWQAFKNCVGVADLDPDQIQNMTLEEFTDAVTAELLRGRKFGEKRRPSEDLPEWRNLNTMEGKEQQYNDHLEQLEREAERQKNRDSGFTTLDYIKQRITDNEAPVDIDWETAREIARNAENGLFSIAKMSAARPYQKKELTGSRSFLSDTAASAEVSTLIRRSVAPVLESVKTLHRLSNNDEKVNATLTGFEKILKSVETGKKLDDFTKPVTVKNLITSLNVAGFLRGNNGSASAYLKIDDRTIRISDHAADAKNFTTANNLSVKMMKGRGNKPFNATDKNNVVEVSYGRRYLEQHPDKLAGVLRDIAEFAVTGEFHDTTGAAKYEFSGTEEYRTKTILSLCDDAVAREDAETLQKLQQQLPTRNGRMSVKNPNREKKLIAIHNIDSEKLSLANELGGFAAPSIAITKKNIGHKEFGDISLLMKPAAIDPKANRRNNIYSADAYTPTMPKMEVEIDTRKVAKIASEFGKLFEKSGLSEVLKPETDYYLSDYDGIQERFGDIFGLYRILGNESIKAAYLIEKGKTIKPVIEEQSIAARRMPLSLDWIPNSWFKELAKNHRNLVLDENNEVLSNDALETNGKEMANVLRSMYIKDSRSAAADYESKYTDDQIAGDKFSGKVPYAWMRKFADAVKDVIAGKGEPRPSKYATEDAINKMVNSSDPDYIKWFKRKFADAFGQKGFENGKEYITENGTRRTWKQLHDPATVENAVKIMQKREQQGDGFGGMNAFAVAARKFKNLDEVRKESYRLKDITHEEERAIKNELEKEITELAREYQRSTGREPSFGDLRTAEEMMLEAWRLSKGRPGKLLDELNYKGSEYHVDEGFEARYITAMSKLARMTTNYFEAKPMRPIYWNEIAAAIVPDNADPNTVQIMRDNGQRIYTYKAGDETDRRRVMNIAANENNALFHAGTPEPVKPGTFVYDPNAKIKGEIAMGELEQTDAGIAGAIEKKGALRPWTKKDSPADKAKPIAFDAADMVMFWRALGTSVRNPKIVKGENIPGRKNAIGLNRNGTSIEIVSKLFGVLDQSDVNRIKTSMKEEGYFRNEDPEWAAGAKKVVKEAERGRSDAELDIRLKKLYRERVQTGEGGMHYATQVLGHEIGHTLGQLSSGQKLGPVGDAMRDLYEQMNLELRRGSNVLRSKKGEITPMEEAKGLIAWWHGTEEMPAYYEKPKERFAELFGIFLTQPESVQQHAPKTYDMIVNLIGKNEKLMKAYRTICEMKWSGKSNDALMTKIRETWNEEASKQYRELNSLVKKQVSKFRDWFNWALNDRFGPIFGIAERTLNAQKATWKKAVNDGQMSQQEMSDRVKAREEELGQLKTSLYNWQRQSGGQTRLMIAGFDEVKYNAEKSNVNWNDVRDYAHAMRVIELGGRATAHGADPARMAAVIEQMKAKLGLDAFAKVEETWKAYRAVYERFVLDDPNVKELFDENTNKMLMENRHYVTMKHRMGVEETEEWINKIKEYQKGNANAWDPCIDVQDRLQKGLGGSGGEHGNGFVLHKLVGSFEATEDPLAATMKRAIELKEAAARNHLIMGISETLRSIGVKGVFDSTGSKSHAVDSSVYGKLFYMKDGEKHELIVPKVIWAGFKSDPMSFGMFGKTCRFIRNTMTLWNPAFINRAYLIDKNSLETNIKGLHKPVVDVISEALCFRGIGIPLYMVNNYLARFTPIAKTWIGKILWNENTVNHYAYRAQQIARMAYEGKFGERLAEAAKYRENGDLGRAAEIEENIRICQEMLRRNVFQATYEFDVEQRIGASVDDMLRGYGYRVQDPEAKGLAGKTWNLLKKWGRYWNRFEEEQEATTKIIAYLYKMKEDAKTENVGDKAIDARAREVIELGGTPNLAARGVFASYIENATGFFWNVRKEGALRTIRAAIDHPTEWITKNLLQTAAPALLKNLMLTGGLKYLIYKLFDDDEEKIKKSWWAPSVLEHAEFMNTAMKCVPGYYQRNYNIIPIAKFGNEVISMRVKYSPEEFAIQNAIHTSFNMFGKDPTDPEADWSTLTEGMWNEMLPNIFGRNYILDAVGTLVGPLVGINPYDSYRQRNIYDKTTWEVRWDKPGHMLKEMGRNFWNYSPLGQFLTPFKNGQERKLDDSDIPEWFDQVLQTPFVRMLPASMLTVTSSDAYTKALMAVDEKKKAYARIVAADILMNCIERQSLGGFAAGTKDLPPELRPLAIRHVINGWRQYHMDPRAKQFRQIKSIKDPQLKKRCMEWIKQGIEAID